MCMKGIICFLLSLAPFPAFTNDSITIHMQNHGAEVPASMYGIFFEEINHAGDGGLYAELVQNRSFEELNMPEGYHAEGPWLYPAQTRYHLDGKVRSDRRYRWTSEQIPGWELESPNAVMSLTTDAPVSVNAPTQLHLTLNSKETVRLINRGYWGMAVKAGEKYFLRTIIKTSRNYKGTIKAKIVSHTNNILAETTLYCSNKGQWNDIRYELIPSFTDSKSHLILEFAEDVGQIWLDYVSLFPDNTFNHRPNGLRRDVAQALADLRPAFFRWPGGCVVEGITLNNRFEWKKTLGDPARRPGEYSTWGYRCSYGMGWHEILQYCEDIGAKAMYVCNVGLACQFRMGESCQEDSVRHYLDDCIDAIEYAIGNPAQNKWARLRAEAGHPDPFPLGYVEIGNENWGPVYDRRFDYFYEELKKRYPQLTFIYNEMPDREGPSLIKKTDMIDPHWYETPQFFYGNSHMFDSWERGKYTIYVGEYACNRNVGGGKMVAALSEAAFISGMERNSDLVRMTSYAPLLENRHDRRWATNLIWLDADQVVGRSSYYVQKMFAENRPTYNVKTTHTATDSLHHVIAGYDRQAKELIVKVVNGSDLPYITTIAVEGAGRLGTTATSITLKAGNLNDENSFDNPRRIYPQTESISLEWFRNTKQKLCCLTFPKYSFTVIRIKAEY